MSDPTSTRYVVLDVDVGCDDAWAIFMLLKAETEMNVKLLAITCVAGNTTVANVTQNVARVLQCAGRTDIPVFRGAAAALIGGPPCGAFHGVDGLGDIQHDGPEPDMSVLRSENAVNALHRLVHEFPHQITLLCCGPLTNVALALRTYADFGAKLSGAYIMGGNFNGVGNTSNCAEFNFYFDAEAAHIVLSSLTCPTTILPWEACTRRSLSITMKWRVDVLGRIDHPYVRFLNPIETAIFPDHEPTWAACDALMVACWLWPERVIQRQRSRHCTVELQGQHTRGQMVIGRSFARPALECNVMLVEQLNSDECKDVFRWTVDDKCFNKS